MENKSKETTLNQSTKVERRHLAPIGSIDSFYQGKNDLKNKITLPIVNSYLGTEKSCENQNTYKDEKCPIIYTNQSEIQVTATKNQEFHQMINVTEHENSKKDLQFLQQSSQTPQHLGLFTKNESSQNDKAVNLVSNTLRDIPNISPLQSPKMNSLSNEQSRIFDPEQKRFHKNDTEKDPPQAKFKFNLFSKAKMVSKFISKLKQKTNNYLIKLVSPYSFILINDLSSDYDSFNLQRASRLHVWNLSQIFNQQQFVLGK